MKVSSAMIAEALAGVDVRCAFHEQDKLLNLERFALYNGEMDLKGNTLYVFPDMAECHPRLLRVEPGAALLFYEKGVEMDDTLFPQKRHHAAGADLPHHGASRAKAARRRLRLLGL